MSILSENIIVFPAVKRTYDYKTSRYLNEYNIVNIIKHITDISSYIISCVPNSTTTTHYDIEFVIEGYYFQLTDLDISSFEGNVYAQINIVNGELVGQDEEEEENNDTLIYTGLTLTIDPDITHLDTVFNLLLFNYNSESQTYSVAEENFAKFKDSAVENIHIIDCGTI